MQLSIIILNYNVRYFLEQCVLSVTKALKDIDGEIIVVDNNSTDGSCDMIQKYFPSVKLIQNKANLGFPRGNNQGVAVASGKLICILNPDTVVAEDTFHKIMARHNAMAPNVGIIGCKLIDGTGCFLPESKRGIPTPWVAFTKIAGLYKLAPKSKTFNAYYASHLSEHQSGEVEILVGAFMILERELYLKVGGFDENCFMYSDDIDLSYMVFKQRKFNYYFHNTTSIHYKGESTTRDKEFVNRFSEAMNYFYKKHFNSHKNISFFSLFMRLGAFVFSLLKKRQQKNTKITVDEYIVFTKKSSLLNWDKKTTYYTSFDAFNNDFKTNKEVIFDIQSFSFKEIIAFMERHKAFNITFKNYISQSNYLIGSNHANDKGEVIVL